MKPLTSLVSHLYIYFMFLLECGVTVVKTYGALNFNIGSRIIDDFECTKARFIRAIF